MRPDLMVPQHVLNQFRAMVAQSLITMTGGDIIDRARIVAAVMNDELLRMLAETDELQADPEMCRDIAAVLKEVTKHFEEAGLR